MVHWSAGWIARTAESEREIRNPYSEYSVGGGRRHGELDQAQGKAQFVILNGEQRHVHDFCFAESQRIVPARVSGRGIATRAGVDDAAGGTLFAGISRVASEARVFGSLQDA